MTSLDRIALIAHAGGLQDVDCYEALCLIRKLTIKQWETHKSRVPSELSDMVADAKVSANNEYKEVAG